VINVSPTRHVPVFSGETDGRKWSRPAHAEAHMNVLAGSKIVRCNIVFDVDSTDLSVLASLLPAWQKDDHICAEVVRFGRAVRGMDDALVVEIANIRNS